MTDFSIDDHNRFVIKNFSQKRPFSSFLPGIAGSMGIPLWVFYVNRGQAIASFGVKDKDSPIMEFQPANKAYRLTPYEGFRTFIKIQQGASTSLYEPFAPWSSEDQSQMSIGMNEVELEVTNQISGLKTSVLYFLLPNEPHTGLVRQVTVNNISQSSIDCEILDGLPIVIPYGISNWGLKEINRTLEAWMAVFYLESGIPFFRLLASSDDTAEVSDIQSGHFYLSFNGQGRLLPVLTDPDIIFGHKSSLHSPEKFTQIPLVELVGLTQITRGKTPCGFAALSTNLKPGEKVIINSVIGHSRDPGLVLQHQESLRKPGYLNEKRIEANHLTDQITSVIGTKSGIPEFDAYCRQTFLDNILRGGFPLILGGNGLPDNTVYHIYGRKHGDLERDYNNFHLDPEPYSQGNGNYRDINQNRRNDVFFEPRVADFNIRTFMNLIQADGHNPLVLLGSRFTISKEAVETIIGELAVPVRLEAIIARPFRLGELIQTIDELQAEGKLEHGFSTNYIFKHATQYIDAEFHEGYWIDHWTYNLDLIEDYLSIYPDKEEELLFGEPSYTYYDSAYIIKPRSQKYVKVDDRVRQYAAVVEDKEKNSLFAARIEPANVMRGENGKGDIFKSTLFEKLTLLVILKFATMDPDGMGIEMESGRPGWYDALNGLPGLFGSSLSETFELERLLRFMLTKLEKYQNPITLPGEAADLLRQITGLIDNYFMSKDPERDFYHWDNIASNRERYRERVRLGFSGRLDAITHTELVHGLGRIHEKISDGLGRVSSIYRDIVPTYFYYEVLDYTYEFDESGQLSADEQNRPFIRAKRFKRHTLPIFLEGPTKQLKITEDTAAAEKIHSQVLASPLFDRPLGLFRICASLSGEPHEIGRARAFTPGWLENESIWTHMSYKYLLSLLETGLYEEFFTHFQKALPPNMDPEIYGRSVLENCSFIVSTAHPDDSIHGTGFVARLSGVAAEFLSIWRIMMAGKNPFSYAGNQLQLALKPILPDWIFNDSGEVSFTFLGHTKITYHNPECRPTFKDDIQISSIKLELEDDQKVVIDHEAIGEPYSGMVRDGKINSIHIYFSEISP